jgi:hypothetical protein
VALCVDTSENVTSSDFASVYGLSFIITVRAPEVPDGPVDDPHAYEAASAVAIARAEMRRIPLLFMAAAAATVGPFRRPAMLKLEHWGFQAGVGKAGL